VRRLRGTVGLYVITKEKKIKFNHVISTTQVMYSPRRYKYGEIHKSVLYSYVKYKERTVLSLRYYITIHTNMPRNNTGGKNL